MKPYTATSVLDSWKKMDKEFKKGVDAIIRDTLIAHIRGPAAVAALSKKRGLEHEIFQLERDTRISQNELREYQARADSARERIAGNAKRLKELKK